MPPDSRLLLQVDFVLVILTKERSRSITSVAESVPELGIVVLISSCLSVHICCSALSQGVQH